MNLLKSIVFWYGAFSLPATLLIVGFFGYRTYRLYRQDAEFRAWLWGQFPRLNRIRNRFNRWLPQCRINADSTISGILFVLATLVLLLVSLIITSPMP